MWGKTSDTKPLSSLSTAHPATTVERSIPAQAGTHAPDPPTRAGSASIGKSTHIHGELFGDEELYFDGEFDGKIEVRNRLTIGPNGKIKASVKAKELVVRGSIQGNVEATDRISIMNGASIVGDVKTAGIVIEDGAYFKGGIDILRPEAAKKPAEPVTAPGPRAHSAGAV